jgi:hypothetical protein
MFESICVRMKAPTISRAIEQTEGDFLLGLDLSGGAVELGGVLARRNSLHAHQLNCTNCSNNQYFIQMMPSVIASKYSTSVSLAELGADHVGRPDELIHVLAQADSDTARRTTTTTLGCLTVGNSTYH